MAPTISESTFTATMWSGVAVSACFIFSRLFFRIKVFEKVFADDGLVVLAWLMQLARSILLQCTKQAMFLQQASKAQEYLPHFPYVIATSLLFLAGLWTVKLSFLLLYRALVQRVRGQIYIWRWITTITIISGVVCLVFPWWICLLGKDGKSDEKCTGRRATDLRRIALLFGSSVDIATDALILFMPSYLLWKVQVNWRRKIAPGGVLFFNIFVITFAIVRIIVASVGQGHADEIQLYLWSNLDFAMAIIVACISPFRQRNTRRERGPAQARPVVARITTYLHSTLGQLRKRNKAPSNFSDGIVLVDLEPSAGRSFASLGSLAIDPIVPLDFISVRHDIGESSDLQSGEVQFTKTSTGSPHMPRDAS